MSRPKTSVRFQWRPLNNYLASNASRLGHAPGFGCRAAPTQRSAHEWILLNGRSPGRLNLGEHYRLPTMASPGWRCRVPAPWASLATDQDQHAAVPQGTSTGIAVRRSSCDTVDVDIDLQDKPDWPQSARLYRANVLRRPPTRCSATCCWAIWNWSACASRKGTATCGHTRVFPGAGVFRRRRHHLHPSRRYRGRDRHCQLRRVPGLAGARQQGLHPRHPRGWAATAPAHRGTTWRCCRTATPSIRLGRPAVERSPDFAPTARRRGHQLLEGYSTWFRPTGARQLLRDERLASRKRREAGHGYLQFSPRLPRCAVARQQLAHLS